MRRYATALDDGRLEISNNAAENKIRPAAMTVSVSRTTPGLPARERTGG